jgi:hypothetical protein
VWRLRRAEQRSRLLPARVVVYYVLSLCYSVPYRLARQQVDVRLSAATVEVCHRGQRVASHARSLVRHGYLGISGKWGVARAGFTELVARVCGDVGAIFGIEITRLARSNADVARLAEFARITAGGVGLPAFGHRAGARVCRSG